MIRSLILLMVLFSISCQQKASVSSADTSTTDSSTRSIYLVRHAEKVDDGTKDPDLTEEGRLRAAALYETLISANIASVYSSDYKRTRNTAQPTAEKRNLPIQIYNPGALEDFSKELLSQKGDALVLGHSNSTPSLANHLLSKEVYESYDESEYDHIIIIKISGDDITSSMMDYNP